MTRCYGLDWTWTWHLEGMGRNRIRTVGGNISILGVLGVLGCLGESDTDRALATATPGRSIGRWSGFWLFCVCFTVSEERASWSALFIIG